MPQTHIHTCIHTLVYMHQQYMVTIWRCLISCSYFGKPMVSQRKYANGVIKNTFKVSCGVCRGVFGRPNVDNKFTSIFSPQNTGSLGRNRFASTPTWWVKILYSWYILYIAWVRAFVPPVCRHSTMIRTGNHHVFALNFELFILFPLDFLLFLVKECSVA